MKVLVVIWSLAVIGLFKICALAESNVEEAKPVLLRIAEEQFEQGRYEKGAEALDQVLAVQEGRKWVDYADYLKAHGLLKAGKYDEFEGEVNNVLSQEPPFPYAANLFLELAQLKAETGRVEEAIALWKELASKQPASQESGVARVQMLRVLYDEERYEDYLRTCADFPALGMFRDGGESAFHSGLIRLKLDGDAAAARRDFESAVSMDGQWKAQSSAARDWCLMLLQAQSENVSDSQIAAAFRQWVRQTQGAADPQINPVDTARRTLNFARKIHDRSTAGAIALCHAISQDPVYGIHGARAEKQALEWEGDALSASLPRFQHEERAYLELRKALEESRKKNYEGAERILNDLITQYRDTHIARDAYLRRAYVVYLQGRKDDSADSFRAALDHNRDLGVEHPLNQQAAFRLKNIEHGRFYSTARDHHDDPSKNPENKELLDHVADLAREWTGAIPADGPDQARARLETAGIFFEKTLGSPSPESWTQVRDYLTTAVISQETYPEAIRATASLMRLETFYHEQKSEEVIAACEGLWADFPTSWRELGTSCYFSWMSCVRMGDRAAGGRYMARVRERIPPDAPRFHTLNYHALALYAEAQEAAARGDYETYREVRDLAKLRFPDDPVVTKSAW